MNTFKTYSNSNFFVLVNQVPVQAKAVIPRQAQAEAVVPHRVQAEAVVPQEVQAGAVVPNAGKS